MTLLYPINPAERTEWILANRPNRNALDPERPYAFLNEDECSADGEVLPVATVFLTNRECPWRCLMCDLWKNTLSESVPPGAIPRQIDYALSQLPPARQIKLYNSGSFFDPRAIPVEDYPAIASLVKTFEKTIVECHPALVTERCLQFRDLLLRPLEVAMGLETSHPEVLDKLNKRMTLETFAAAASFLRTNQMDLRVFILIQPPFMKPAESLYWAQRSLDFAFDFGATAASLIPTRAGNGTMEILELQNSFTPPNLDTVEAAFEYGLTLQRGRVFIDLWDISHAISGCAYCHPKRVERLHKMNLSQQITDRIVCTHSEGHR